jgi:uncharacterized protein (DUF433 family)
MEPIKSDPQIMGGTPCFAGTRVPVKSLFDHLARGYTIGYFLDDFPSVTGEQVAAVLALAARTIPPPPVVPANAGRIAG